LRTRGIQNVCYERDSAAKDEVLPLWYSQVIERALERSKSFRSSSPRSGFERNLWKACLSEPDGLQTAQDHSIRPSITYQTDSRKAALGWIWVLTERFAVCTDS